uniref:Uncharacterized protein n=1 Tax=Anguilla anguilla TaxID=7936 RepID=A0A0E9WFB3_ANGAN
MIRVEATEIYLKCPANSTCSRTQTHCPQSFCVVQGEKTGPSVLALLLVPGVQLQPAS